MIQIKTYIILLTGNTEYIYLGLVLHLLKLNLIEFNLARESCHPGQLNRIVGKFNFIHDRLTKR